MQPSRFEMTGVREKARFGGSNLGDHISKDVFPDEFHFL